MNKIALLESLIITYSPHIIIITETWLRPEIGDHEICPPGYRILRKDREGRGGGVAIVYDESLVLSRLEDIEGIECVWASVTLRKNNVIIGAVYRPPQTDLDFFFNLNEYLCRHCLSNRNLIVAGDFNVPDIDWTSPVPIFLAPSAEPLVDIVVFHNLTQLVKEPTRESGGSASTLDLVLISDRLASHSTHTTLLPGISDHKVRYSWEYLTTLSCSR